MGGGQATLPDLFFSSRFLIRSSKFEEVFDDVATFGILLGKQLGMELDAVNASALFLHCLYPARLVGGGCTKTIRQLFNFVTVVVPDSYLRRQSFEESLACILDRQETALTFGSVIAFAGFESSHQSDFSAISDRNLLVTTTHAEDGLACTFDDVENSGQRLRRILIPRMTLPTENDVRRAQTAHSLERHVLERLNEDLEAGNQTPKHRAKLAWACALTIDSVVDEVNEQVKTSNSKASH